VFVVTLIFLIVQIDRIIGIFLIINQNLQDISKKHQFLGERIYTSRDWKNLEKKLGKEKLSKLGPFKKELLLYETKFPKKDELHHSMHQFAYILGAIKFLGSEIKEYERGVPLSRLAQNLYYSQFFHEDVKDIELKISVLAKEGFVKIENNLVSLGDKDEIKDLLEYHDFEEERWKQGIDKVIKTWKEEELSPPDFIGPPTSFLAPFYYLISIPRMIIWKRKEKRFMEKLLGKKKS
jgi:low affinity Fe/Cu permease